MPLSFYKPTPANTGCCISINASLANQAFYLRMLKQASWDAKAKTGSFKENVEKPEKNVVVKLSTTEVGAILDCIETNRKATGYHRNEEGATTFDFYPFMRKIAGEEGEPEKTVQVGFAVNVTKNAGKENAQKFALALTYAEARVLKEYLIFNLKKIFHSLDVVPRKKSEPNES